MRVTWAKQKNIYIHVHEHSSDINKKIGSPSVISDYHINFNHFDLEKIKILHRTIV